MQVLMISMDPSILSGSEDTPGDTQLRHIKYAAALRERYPDGSLTVLAKAPRSHPAKPVQVTDALTIHPVPSGRMTFPLAAWRSLSRLVGSQSFDLATTQTPFDDALVGTWLRRRYGVPLNVQMRSSFLDQPNWIKQRRLVYGSFNTLGKWVVRHADTIRVLSRGEKARLESKFPDLRGRIDALHPLVNFDLFDREASAKELQHTRAHLTNLGLDDDRFLFFVGRLTTEKNVPLLLKAFSLIHKRDPGLALVVVGNGPSRDRLERQSRELSLDGSVVWLGNLPLKSLRGWFASARATVLPSLQEGLPKVIPESYLMGTPTVITPFVCGPELVRDGETGFVTASFSDPAELADRMERLGTSPELSQRMGEEGRQHIKDYLAPEDEYMARLIDLWERTAQLRRGPKAVARAR